MLATGPTTPEEDRVLAAAIATYQAQKIPDDFSAFESFLRQYPNSAWRAALQTDLGLANYHYGYFSRAIDAWEDAWARGKVSNPEVKPLIDRAVGELVRMHARLGHVDRLAALIDEIGDRPVTGPATETLTGAKEGLWAMRNEPGIAYLCGPKALQSLMLSQNKTFEQTAFIEKFRSSPKGVSLAEVAKLAQQAKQPYTLAFREAGTPLPLPALVHWKASHFATIVAEENGRFHVKDPTFGRDLWITQGALDSESSGYFLLPMKQVPKGFRKVDLAEASNVRGMGYTGDNDPWATAPDDNKGHPPCPNAGMCGANFHAMVVSLNLTDTPVGYAPPKGPSVFFTLTYNQREANQPATFNFSNVGPKWTTNWLSYIQDDPTAAGANVLRYVAGGGSRLYSGYNSGTGNFLPESRSAAVLTRLTFGSAVYYRRTLSDGTIEFYALSDGATTYPRRFFLNQVIDPAGNTVGLSYDAQRRLTAITDALGQATTLSYGIAAKPLLITAITDPFGRSAQITYDTSWRLQSITDTIGMASQFGYDASGLVNSMTTPYGTSNFAYAGTGASRWLEITDPLGFTERAEFRHQAPGIPFSESKVPTGINPFNQYIDARNTFFWDKSLYPTTHTDYTKAEIKHWFHDPVGAYAWTSPVLESIKRPLESRIWFNYPGQVSPWVFPGTLDKPSAIGRVLDNNSTQLSQTTYNSLGNRTSVTDPDGHQTFYDYATNQVDIVAIRQKTGATSTTIAQFTYNTQHQPLTSVDANGRTMTFTYNGAGQRLTATDPLGHTTTYNYNTAGYLTSVVDANGIAAVTNTYDAAGRVATRTDAGGNTLTYQYDNLNRQTRITYPDATFIQFQWNKLDLASVTDRLGRITQYTYDANRQLTAVTDPASHTTQYAYYPNGQRKSITDANSGLAQWGVDIQGRVTTATDPKGVQTLYGYDGAGRLSTENSPDSGLKQFTYDAADDLIKKVDARGVETDYTYDAYNRLISTTFPASAAENITNVYDDTNAAANRLGRLNNVSNTGSTATFTYDAGGNITQRDDLIGSALSSTLYQYDNTNRVTQITYPSGRIVIYTRNNLGQVTQVQTKDNASSPLQTIVSNVNYEPFGPIKSLTYGNGVVTTIQHDANFRVNRITSTSIPTWDFAFGYDTAGNILSITDQHTPATYSKTYSYDNLNRVTADSSPSGSVGYLYDANGNRTQMSFGPFALPLTYASASNRETAAYGFPITQDSAGNIITTSGSSGPGLAAQYNNANQMSQSTFIGSNLTTYQYNGMGQRVRKQSTLTTHYTYLLDGKYLTQLQLNTNSTYNNGTEYIWLNDVPVAQIQNTYGASNVVTASKLSYIHTDHLNTPRAMTNSAKSLVWRWDADAYGSNGPNQDPGSTGTQTTLDLRYPGQISDSETSSFYNINRYYDPTVGRYLQPDPIGLRGGFNPYIYTLANPIRFADPLGLEVTMTCRPISQAAALGLPWPVHCGVIVWHWEQAKCDPLPHKVIDSQYSLPEYQQTPTHDPNNDTYQDDRSAFNNPGGNNHNHDIAPPPPFSQSGWDSAVTNAGDNYSQGEYNHLGPNSNTAATGIIGNAGGQAPDVPGAIGQGAYGPPQPIGGGPL